MSTAEKTEKVSGSLFDLRIIRHMLGLLAPHTWHFLGVLALMLLLSVLAPLSPLIIQHTLDVHLPASDAEGVWGSVLLLFALLCLQSATQYSYLYSAGSLGQRIIGSLRSRLYDHVQRLSLGFFDKTPIGRLVTRCVSDIETLLNVFSEGLASILGDICLLIALGIVMALLDVKLMLISLASMPLLMLSTYVFKEGIKEAFNRVRTAVSNLNAFVQEHITGMSLVHIFGAEARTASQFRELNLDHRRAHMRSVRYHSIYFPIAEILLALSIGLLIAYGTTQIIQESLTLGKLVAFIMYVQMFFRPIRMIADRFNTLQLGVVSTQRIFSLLANKEWVVNQGTLRAKELRGEVTFSDVWFHYEEGVPVLKGLSFHIAAGQMVALVGETGSGKTSTIHLLNRLYEPQQGKVLLDGHALDRYQLDSLRQHVAFVLQDVFLFSDSLRNNITLFNPDISDQKIRETAKKMDAWAMIESLGGLDHEVSERGSSLSVGQRQMISFLRAMVYNPRVLVLDEATSSIDNQTEAMVQRATFTLMKGRTTLVVAHRLSTIQHADHILVLSAGKVIEEGTHEEMLHKKGPYYTLYEAQYAGQLARGPHESEEEPPSLGSLVKLC